MIKHKYLQPEIITSSLFVSAQGFICASGGDDDGDTPFLDEDDNGHFGDDW